MSITDTQSYGFVIRNMLIDRLAASPFFQGFTVRKSRILQIQKQHLPYLGAYLMDEQMVGDGDINTGEIRFTNTTKIGFSVFVINNDPVDCEAKLDEAYWAICNTLWRDQALMSWGDTMPYVVGGGGVGNPDNTRIESISRGSRNFVYGSTALDNETPVGELRYEVSVVHRNEFAAIVPDDLLEAHLTTGVKPGETRQQMAERQQVGGYYELIAPGSTKGVAAGKGNAKGS